MRRVPVPLLAVLLVAAVQALAWSVLLPAFQGQDEAAALRLHPAHRRDRQADVVGAGGRAARARRTRRRCSSALEAGGFGPLGRNVGDAPVRHRDRRGALAGAGRPDHRRAARRRQVHVVDAQPAALLPLQARGLRAAARGRPCFTRLDAMRLGDDPVPPRRRALGVAARRRGVRPAPLAAGGRGAVRRAPADARAARRHREPGRADRRDLGGRRSGSRPSSSTAGATRGRAARRAGARGRRGAAHPRARAPVAVVLAAALAVRAWRAARPAGPRRRLAASPRSRARRAAAAWSAARVWSRCARRRRPRRVREFASYLWQFYLPRPGFMTPDVRPDWDARDVFVDRLWSGLRAVRGQPRAGVLDAISRRDARSALVLLVATLVVRRDAVRAAGAWRSSLLVAAFAAPVLLHVAAWRDLPVEPDPIITGRYLDAAAAARRPRHRGVVRRAAAARRAGRRDARPRARGRSSRSRPLGDGGGAVLCLSACAPGGSASRRRRRRCSSSPPSCSPSAGRGEARSFVVVDPAAVAAGYTPVVPVRPGASVCLAASTLTPDGEVAPFRVGTRAKPGVPLTADDARAGRLPRTRRGSRRRWKDNDLLHARIEPPDAPCTGDVLRAQRRAAGRRLLRARTTARRRASRPRSNGGAPAEHPAAFDERIDELAAPTPRRHRRRG